MSSYPRKKNEDNFPGVGIEPRISEQEIKKYDVIIYFFFNLTNIIKLSPLHCIHCLICVCHAYLLMKYFIDFINYLLLNVVVM